MQNSDLHGTASDGFDLKILPNSKRRLEERAPVRRELILFSPQFPPNITSPGEKPLLPLERYVRKQQETVTEIKKDLENERKNYLNSIRSWLKLEVTIRDTWYQVETVT